MTRAPGGSCFTRFPNRYRAAVFGASGGIGAAFVAALADDPRCALIYAGARKAIASGGKVRPFHFDLENEASIEAAAATMRKAGGVDFVLVATGLLSDDTTAPEKTWRSLAAAPLARSFAINAIGPSLIAKHTLELLPREHDAVFAALSARVGSIGDNRLGGWHGYRASKAALNMIIKCCAIELARRNPKAICVSLHPGTVDTRLSAPFQRNVAAEKLFSPDDAARNLIRVLDGLSPDDSGGCYAWDGAKIPA